MDKAGDREYFEMAIKPQKQSFAWKLQDEGVQVGEVKKRVVDNFLETIKARTGN